MQKTVSQNFKTLKGEITIPSDKSMSHRAILFSSIAKGRSIIKNFSNGKDPHSSIEVCKNLGIDIKINSDRIVEVNSNGLKMSKNNLYCGNSGTTMRLISGILAGQNFDSVLTGDESLSSRPMKRIIEPLRLMGANIESNDFKAPIIIKGSELHGIEYNSKLSSAQVKSCVLLAGLFANGVTTYKEPQISRNHTEILLKYMGAKISCQGNFTKIEKSELNPINTEIFGDISSAAFFIVAGLIVPNSDIILKNVGLNPTRTGIIDVVKKMGADIELFDIHEICAEKVGNIRVKYSPDLKGIDIDSTIIPRLIDEIPIISVLATQCQGITKISGAQDLKNKESDRILTTVTELKKLGANITATQDGMIIEGKTKLKGNVLTESYRDHRLALSLYVAGLISENEISINDFDWINISFPEFENLMQEIRG